MGSAKPKHKVSGSPDAADSGGDVAPAAASRNAADSGGDAAPAAASRNAADAGVDPLAAGDGAAGVSTAPLPEEEQERATSAEPDSPETAEDDHQRAVELDLEELVVRAEKADQYLELAQRTKADFENYRKRTAREVAAAQERGVTKLARELLPAVDNLDRALAAAEAVPADGRSEQANTLVAGIKLVHEDVVAALARVGIEPFAPEGEAFDPQLHEAMAQQPVQGAQAGTIVEVYQRGYRLGDAILRPARVVVAG